MYNTLYILDYTAEILELIYELGAATRKYLVPVLAAAYVAVVMVVEYVQALSGPSRSQMIQDLTREWEKILALDSASKPEESLEFLWYCQSLSDEELKAEWEAL